MNADNIPASKWSVLFYVLLLLLSLMIFGCDSSTENKENPSADPFETRIVYQKSNTGDVNYYSANLSGSSELLCDVTKFEGILDNPSWITFNPLMKKVMYYNDRERTITISDYDGGNPVPVKIGETEILDSLAGPITKVALHYSSTGNWALCEVNNHSYKIDMNGMAKEINLPRASDWIFKTSGNVIPRLSFTEDGNWFAFGIGYFLAVRDTTGKLVKLYQGYNSHDVKIMPKGERIFFSNSDAAYGQDLFYMDLGSDAEMNITPDSLDVTDFCISPDGKYVIYAAYNSANRYALLLYDIVNNSTSVLINDKGYNQNPLFISDDEIAWQSGASTISTMKIDGSGKRVLLENAVLLGAGYFKMR